MRKATPLLLSLGLALALATGAGATSIPVDLTLAPTSGPAGSGTFVWDDATGAVTGLSLRLAAFGPFAGRPQNGAPLWRPALAPSRCADVARAEPQRPPPPGRDDR